MNRVLLQHTFCFLAGLVVTSAFVAVTPATSPQPAGSVVSSRSAGETRLPLRIAAESKQEKRDEKQLQRLMDTALPVIRACDPQERAARWGLLLAQLRREGDAGFAVMAAFLATGEDLPIGHRIDLPGLRLRGASTLRMAALEQVNWMSGPAARQAQIEGNLETLRQGKSAYDAVQLIRNLEHFDPGKHRNDAIVAMQRIASSEARASSPLAEVISHFGAAELLPVAEKKALEEQKDGAFADLFGALWKVPAEQRDQVTTRMLSRADIGASNMTGALDKLDYRISAAREYAAAWFSSERPITAKAEAIERLGRADGFGPRIAFPADDWKPDPSVGTPGTAAQAEARLALLKEIEPFSNDALIRQKLAEARASLEQQLVNGR